MNATLRLTGMTATTPAAFDRVSDRRRRRRQNLQAMLRALARPLLFANQARRRAKASAPEPVQQSLDSLSSALASASRVLARRLAACGVREARRFVWQPAVRRLRVVWSDATEWTQPVIAACRACATRVCATFRTAEAMADRATSRVAYGVLRALEKELWFLQSHIFSVWRTPRV